MVGRHKETGHFFLCSILKCFISDGKTGQYKKVSKYGNEMQPDLNNRADA